MPWLNGVKTMQAECCCQVCNSQPVAGVAVAVANAMANWAAPAQRQTKPDLPLDIKASHIASYIELRCTGGWGNLDSSLYGDILIALHNKSPRLIPDKVPVTCLIKSQRNL